MKRRVLILMLCLSLLIGLIVLPAAATVASDPEKVVYDRVDLLSDAEESELTKAVHQACRVADCSFYVATHELQSRYDPYYIGEDFCYDLGLSYSTDFVLLVITLDGGTYYYNMYYYGRVDNAISTYEVDYILDHEDVYGNIKSGKLVEGASAFVSLAAQAYEGRIAGASYAVIVTVSLILALIIGILVCVGVKTSYSTKKKSVDYPLDRFAKLQLTAQNDVFMGAFVTQRIIESNSGGGRGGSGGGRGGGRGHAGGR